MSVQLLEIDSLRSGYGAVEVLHDVSLHVAEGEYVAVIGSNGAGKTTLLRTISGIVPTRSGTLRFSGQNLADIPPENVAAAGIAHVPEGRQIFPDLTVWENLRVGAYSNRDAAVRDRQMALVLELFPRLGERLRQPGGTLSGGEQQMLAVGRALMSNPRLLMLDEPSQGLAPKIVADMYERLHDIHKAGMTVLLVEQNVHIALQYADRAYVIEQGKVVLEGTSDALVEDDRVRQAYLGV